jgi:hypothetical protein
MARHVADGGAGLQARKVAVNRPILHKGLRTVATGLSSGFGTVRRAYSSSTYKVCMLQIFYL